MPRYDYKCYSCDVTREDVHIMSEHDAVVVKCPVCSKDMKVQIGAPLVRGVAIYPFTLKTIRATAHDGKLNSIGDVIVENKEQHREIMQRHKSVTPYLDGSKCNDAPYL